MMRVRARIWCTSKCVNGCQASGCLSDAASCASPCEHGCDSARVTVISAIAMIRVIEVVDSNSAKGMQGSRVRLMSRQTRTITRAKEA